MSATTESMAQRFGSGQAVRRVEDDSLLLGHGQFTDDFRLTARRRSCSCARRIRRP